MEEVVNSVLFLVVGCVLIVFRTSLVRHIEKLHNHLSGNAFPEDARDSLQLIPLMIGVGFVLAGVWPVLAIVVSN